MVAVHDLFKPLDWAVILGYMALTTLVGHRMSGKQATIRDFFLGGRSLPWPAVTGSIIATEISGVTFIGVPGAVYALNGNFTYLQWAIGSILARVIVGMFFVKVFYEEEIYSPYDYMGNRMGSRVKTLATVFFSVGSILAQGVRLLVAALPLKIVTPMPFEWCVVVIGVFAIGWTLMGGMQTVIWTDVMQFVLFAVGGIVALVAIAGDLPGGLGEVIATAGAAGKMDLWNTEFGFGKELEFTLWVALLAVPFQNLGAFGVDQLNAQRMFCCRSAAAARKAIIFSSFGQLLTLLMMMVGAALWVFYRVNPPEGVVAETMAAKNDFVFPVWIVTELPPGVSGLVLAGIFAASVSSLDSILAALSQTTLSLIYKPERGNVRVDEKTLVRHSRMLVVFWGVALVGFTLLLNMVNQDKLISLAFGMTTYTVGPMLAMFIASMVGKGSFRGLLVGSILSFLTTMLVRTDVVGIVVGLWPDSADFFASLPTFKLNAQGAIESVYSYVWMWPLSFFITLGCGLFLPGPRRDPASRVP